VFKLRNWDFHIRCFTIQCVTVLLLFWAPNVVSTYVRLSTVTSLLSSQCTYMPVTERITEHMACRVVQIEISSMRQITPQTKTSIQPWPNVQNVTDNTTCSHDLPYNTCTTKPQEKMTKYFSAPFVLHQKEIICQTVPQYLAVWPSLLTTVDVAMLRSWRVGGGGGGILIR